MASQMKNKYFSDKASDPLKRIIDHGYLIDPEALKILESLNEKEVIEVLDSFLERFPNRTFIEADQIKRILEKPPTKKAAETKDFKPKLSGKITQIYDGSGLIQRCPKCNRWIIDNFCVVHSDVTGIWDLRIKAKFDDGKRRCTLIFKRDITEKCVKITLEEAKKLGEAATLEKIKKSIIGKNVEIDGAELNGGNFLVKNIREI